MTEVRIDTDGALAVLTLDRPERRNAQTPATWGELAAAGRELPGDVRVVAVRGAGPDFCAGLDRAFLADPANTAALARLDDAELDRTLAGYQEAFAWLRRPDLVTVAAVQGHAVGSGFQLALACDLRICADTARFAMRETGLGLVPDLGGTKRLADLAGPARALELCLTGRWADAPEAARLGLADLVVPEKELDAAVHDFTAAVLAAPRNAVIETKALFDGIGERTLTEQRAREREAAARRLRDLAGLGE